MQGLGANWEGSAVLAGVSRSPGLNVRAVKTTMVISAVYHITGLQRLQARVKLGLKPTSLEADGIIDPSEDSAVDYCLEAGIETHLLCHTPTGYFIPGKWDGPPLFDDDVSPSFKRTRWNAHLTTHAQGVLPGSYVGSSAKLLDELVELSPALGVNFRSLSGRLRLAGGFDLTEEVSPWQDYTLVRQHSSSLQSIDSLNADCIASLPSSFRASREESKGEDKQAKTVSSGLQSTPIGASGKPVHVLYRERQVWFALYEGAKQSLKQNTALVLH